MVLIVAAGLLVGTFERLATLPLGFDSDRVLIVNVDVSRAPIDPANRIPFFHQLVAAVAAVPGVARAGGSMATPVGGSASLAFIDLPGAPPAQPEPGPVPFWNSRMTLLNEITPGWLATYGTAVRAGRDIDDKDVQGALPVALVNDAYVRKFLRGRNPIGEIVTFVEAPPRTIVGVVSDAVYLSVRDGVRPTLYIPLAQRDAGRADGHCHHQRSFVGGVARLAGTSCGGGIDGGRSQSHVYVPTRCRIGSMPRSRRSAWSHWSRGSSARWPCCSRVLVCTA